MKKEDSLYVASVGSTKEQIQAKMENIAKAIEYGSKRYAEAMSKGKDATKEDKQAIEDYHTVVVGKLIPAMAELARSY